jgi:uncharacterized protein (DUF362 family)/Pyruvate/2-oxoacid:ferredoxin oxidoreductase delta subunit
MSRVMSKVYIRKSEYDYTTLKPVVFELMDSIVGDRIEKGSSVLIKPNLLAPVPPEMAVVTHPLIVKAAAEYVIDKGVKPQISDSPAVGSFEKILKESGIAEALEGLDVEYKEFKESVRIDVGKPFEKIEIAADVINADLVINLPKIKTHQQMMLTLGVKNLFGCIVGMKKPEWHMRAGVEREKFATLLVKIYRAVAPAVNIYDGILGMEGQGPGKSGDPRKIGVIIGSDDALAADSVICRMLGIGPDTLFTNKVAPEEGFVMEEPVIDGELQRVTNFRFPEMGPMQFGPKIVHGLFRRHLVQRPECNKNACRLCGECWKYCPAEAITHDKEKIRFDYDKCIRCYCCIEVCPYAALRAVETWTGKVARKILKIK